MVREIVAQYLPLSTARSWYGQTLQLILDFDSFVDNKINSPGVKYEVLLMFIIGAAGSLGLYWLSLEVLAVSRLEEMNFVAIARTVRPTAIIFLLWALYTVFFYFVSGHFGGYGHPRRLVKGIAWAFIPFMIANLARSAAVWWTYQDFPIDDELQGFAPAEQFQNLINVGLEDPAMMFGSAVVILCTLWSAWLMIYVLQHARGLSRQTAMRIVAVPYLIHVALIAWYTWQGQGHGALLF